MRQVKRLFYIILLNIVVSAITVVVVLSLWERDHPPLSADSTPVVFLITPTGPIAVPLTTGQVGTAIARPTDTGILVTATVKTTPSVDMLVYKVKEGDTLGGLAAQFNSSVADIMTVNGLADPDSVYIGQILYIPLEPLPTITPTSTPTEVASVTPRPSITATHGPTATSTQTQASLEPQVIIETVLGVGVLANEHVVLQRTGNGALSLAGWHLEDGAGNSYTFPELTLYKDGSINLNTRQGENTVLDLYWGLLSAIWRTGKTAYLYDAQDELRATYTIP